MFKRLLISISLALVAMMLIGEVALATWAFIFPTYIMDTSSVARTYYPVLLGYNGQALVDAGKISSNGTNTNMQVGTSNIKYMLSTTNVTAVIPSLPAGATVAADLYTGYSPVQTAFPIITGSGGYVTVADNASIELGNNFTVEQSGYLNTSSGVGKNTANKTAAFRTYISAVNTLSSWFIASVATNMTLAPEGVGSNTTVGILFGAPTHWEATLTNDGDTSYVQGNWGGGYQQDLYATANSGVTFSGNINSVTVYMVCKGNGDFAETALRTNGTTYNGIQTALGVGYLTYSTVYINNPQTGVGWTWAEIDGMEIGVNLWLQVAAPRCTQVYAVVNYYPGYIVSLTPVLSNIYAIKSYSDGAWFMLSLDGDTSWDGIHSNRIATGSANVTDNGNNWLFMQNDVMPYSDNISLSVNGTRQLYLAPLVMLTGATIPDRSGDVQNGTITWGSNANITLSYGGMESYESYTASANITGGFDMPTATMPSTWFAAGENVTALPFYDSFSNVSAQTGQPVQTLYALGIIGVAFGAFVGVVVFTRSALMAYIAMTAIFGVGASMTIIPAWIVFVMIIMGAGIMFLYKQVAY